MQQPPLVERASQFADRVAIRSEAGEQTYSGLLRSSHAVAAGLLAGRTDLAEERIAFLVPAGPDYVAAQWGVWRAGGVAVPLSLAATAHELGYVLDDAEVTTLIVAGELSSQGESLCADRDTTLHRLDDLLTYSQGSDSQSPSSLPDVTPERRAMILYTSGTTSRPKGVVTSHACIEAQITSLVSAWAWSGEDRIPLFLPLHHIHGIVNVLCCALWSGAVVETFPRFLTDAILARVAENAFTVFMAVPTIYVKLIESLHAMSDSERESIVAGFGEMRLMVSGSAALPASVHEQWTELTGQKLLERYGMTEIGMALSNPYEGERRPGAVGRPLPGVEVRLRSEGGSWMEGEDEPGEIFVRGPGVFQEYWRRSEATREAFQDGWFATGDMAVRERGYFRIMGRRSVDIIKSGGYKLSALEIEASLLDHPAIRECAVVGVTDPTWGEIVAAAVVLTEPASLTLDELQDWCRERISSYKIPRRLLPVDQLPRNAMGKVTKPAVVELFS